MTAQKFRCGVHHDVGAPIERLAEIRGGECVVDHQRTLALMGDLRDLFDVQNITAGVADRLGEQELGVVGDRSTPSFRVVRIDEIETH